MISTRTNSSVRSLHEIFFDIYSISGIMEVEKCWNSFFYITMNKAVNKDSVQVLVIKSPPVKTTAPGTVHSGVKVMLRKKRIITKTPSKPWAIKLTTNQVCQYWLLRVYIFEVLTSKHRDLSDHALKHAFLSNVAHCKCGANHFCEYCRLTTSLPTSMEPISPNIFNVTVIYDKTGRAFEVWDCFSSRYRIAFVKVSPQHYLIDEKAMSRLRYNTRQFAISFLSVDFWLQKRIFLRGKD